VSGSWRKKARVAVAPNLPVAVLLGRDAYMYSEAGEEEVAQGLVAVTRSQSKKAEEEMKERGDARERGEVMADLSPLSEEVEGLDEVDELGMEEVTEGGDSREKDPEDGPIATKLRNWRSPWGEHLGEMVRVTGKVEMGQVGRRIW